MESVSSKVLEQAIQLLGNSDLSQEEVEAKLRESGVKETVAQRLASFIPEAFGVVAAMNMKRKPAFQPTFSASNEQGESEEIPFSTEPIFGLAKSRAEVMYQEGSQEIFKTVSMRSSVMEVIHDAMDKKTFFDGAVVAIDSGVPAEVYREELPQPGETGHVEKVAIPFWKKVLKELTAVEIER